MELISIIVPVYKVENYLDDCVESIVQQTYRNLEIILVDDGSPDQCPAMCDAWAEKDDRIRVIHKANGGAAAARNSGLDLARGEYIGFVDSDDMIRPDMYEILLNEIRSSSKKVVCCYSGWNPDVPYQCNTLKSIEMGVEETAKAIFNRKVGTALWCRLYHCSVWEKLRLPEGEINEDYPVLIPTTVAGGGMVLVCEKLYFYRQTQDSVTATCWKKDTGIVIKNLKLMYVQIEENRLNCLPEFRNFQINAVYSGAISMDKHMVERDETGRTVHREYLKLMRSLFIYAMLGNVLAFKDKLLYCLITVRVFRPVYKTIEKYRRFNLEQ